MTAQTGLARRRGNLTHEGPPVVAEPSCPLWVIRGVAFVIVSWFCRGI